MQNFNNNLRYFIENWVNNGLLTGLDTNESIRKFIEYFYSLLNSSLDKQVFTSYLLSLNFLDAYKEYSYKQKECLQSDIDEDFFGDLCDIKNFNDLYAKATEDPRFLAKILHSTYQFNSLEILGKYTIVKTLYPSENEWLKKLFPIHKLDLQYYDIPITKSTLIDYIKNKVTYQHNIMSMDFKEAIICNIVGFLQNLKKIDIENTTSLLTEIGKNDYATSKYLIEKCHDEDESLIDHIDLYENYDVNDILYNLLNNEDFLKDAVWMLGITYVFHKYDDIPITSTDISCIKTENIEKKLILK